MKRKEKKCKWRWNTRNAFIEDVSWTNKQCINRYCRFYPYLHKPLVIVNIKYVSPKIKFEISCQSSAQPKFFNHCNLYGTIRQYELLWQCNWLRYTSPKVRFTENEIWAELSVMQHNRGQNFSENVLSVKCPDTDVIISLL